MKAKIGKQTFSVNDNYIKSFKTKDEFVKRTVKDNPHVKAEKETFEKVLSEMYDIVVPKKTDKQNA